MLAPMVHYHMTGVAMPAHFGYGHAVCELVRMKRIPVRNGPSRDLSLLQNLRFKTPTLDPREEISGYGHYSHWIRAG